MGPYRLGGQCCPLGPGNHLGWDVPEDHVGVHGPTTTWDCIDICGSCYHPRQCRNLRPGWCQKALCLWWPCISEYLVQKLGAMGTPRPELQAGHIWAHGPSAAMICVDIYGSLYLHRPQEPLASGLLPVTSLELEGHFAPGNMPTLVACTATCGHGVIQAKLLLRAMSVSVATPQSGSA